jgi:hypothetical protein
MNLYYNTSYTFLRSWRRYCGSNSFTKKGLRFMQNKINPVSWKI